MQNIQDGVTSSSDIHEIQRNIRLMSIFSQILEAFNANFEKLLSSIDETTFNEVMSNAPNGVWLRVMDWFSDLSSYQIGDTFAGFISYTLEDATKLCFIKDMTK